MDAVVGAADLAHDPVVADEEDAAAVGVGDGEHPVRKHVRVVGPVKPIRRARRDAGACLRAGNTEEASDAMGLDVDREDVSVVLLVRNERLAARLDEGVVVENQLASLRLVGSRWEDPEESVARIDQEDPIVAAIRDQQRTRQRPPDMHRRVRDPGATASTLGR